MKRILSFALALILLLTLCAAAAPRAGAAGSFYPDGSFPGGLDDDGRGEDEEEYYGPVPQEYLELTPAAQYKANLFLSNFAEQFFGDFSFLEDNAGARAVDFAHIWAKINDRSLYSYKTVDGTSYEVMTLAQVNTVVERYFPFHIEPVYMDEVYPPSDYSFYRDGKFYFLAADGEAYNRIAVATDLTRMSDGSCCIGFAVYEVDLDEYFDRGIDGNYYRLSSLAAADTPSLTRVADGVAYVQEGVWNGRDVYKLQEYCAWGGPGSEDEGYYPFPVDFIDMTAELQHKANLFLSNFAEQFFGNYSQMDDDAAARAVDFAHRWYKINDQNAVTYETVDGEPYETLTADQIDAVVERYFPFALDRSDRTADYPPSDYSFYRDGKFYFLAADGEAYNRIAVAIDLTLMSDDTYCIGFAVYDLDLGEYYDQGIDDHYYWLDTSSAVDDPALTWVADGVAYVQEGTWNGRDVYQLLGYTVWDTADWELYE